VNNRYAASEQPSVMGSGASPHAVEHLSRLWQVFGNAANRAEESFHVTDAVEQITGAEPTTLREFLGHSAFTSPALPGNALALP
jgi:hypothetical protein